jgi:hypothetical protein
VPGKKREPLTFGFPGQANAHTFKGEVIDPVINAAAHLKPLLPKRAPAGLPIAERKRF